MLCENISVQQLS